MVKAAAAVKTALDEKAILVGDPMRIKKVLRYLLPGRALGDCASGLSRREHDQKQEAE